MLVLIGLFAHQATAQSWHYGFKAGYNLSSISHIPTARNIPLGGFATGVFADFAPTKRIHFAPELLYSVQGGKYEYLDKTNGAPRGSQTHSLKYIQLPIIFKVFVTKALHVDIGAQIGRLISSSYSRYFKFPLNNNGYYQNTNSIDYSVVIGVGYNITEHYHAGFRYNYGVNSIYKISPDTQLTQPVNANRVGNFYVGYRL